MEYCVLQEMVSHLALLEDHTHPASSLTKELAQDYSSDQEQVHLVQVSHKDCSRIVAAVDSESTDSTEFAASSSLHCYSTLSQMTHERAQMDKWHIDC